MFTAPERECIEALWRLTALLRAEFEATYGAMLGGFWRYAVAVEDAARLAEVMSFALAACVVAERFPAVTGRAAAPGWRPLTDDVPESAAPASVRCAPPGTPRPAPPGISNVSAGRMGSRRIFTGRQGRKSGIARLRASHQRRKVAMMSPIRNLRYERWL